MGCFLACFGSSKDKKRRHRRSNRVPSGVTDQRREYDSVKQVVYPGESLETAQRVVLPDEIKLVERAGSSKEGKLESPNGFFSGFQNRDKGVDEDRDGIHEPVQPEEASTKKGNLASPGRLDSKSVKTSADMLSSGANMKVISDSVIKTPEPLGTCELLDKEDFSGQERTESLAKPTVSNSLSKAGSSTSSTSSLVSHPPNDRYQNCRESDDEEDDLDYEESDMDVDDGDFEENEYSDGEALSESLCSSESMTGISAGDGISPEVNCKKKVEATDSIRGREPYDQLMLNPVKNLSQWKALEARGKPPLQSRIENSALDLQEMPFVSLSSEPNFNHTASIKSKMANGEQQTQPMAVDTSLSNWLTSPETKAFQNFVPQGSYSPKNLQDRPILGALTVEELKLMSRTSSPRSSPTKSPDDMAIIGSVGSCWSSPESDKDSGSVSSYKGIPNTTSKYREDKRVNWHSTPFEMRLEKALSRGSAHA